MPSQMRDIEHANGIDLSWPVPLVRTIHRMVGTRRGMTRLLQLLGGLTGGRLASVSLVDGRTISLDLADPAAFELVLYGDHRSEGLERDFVRAALNPGAVFYDIGANVGWYATLAAECVGPAGTVIAFEPNPRMMHMLERSLTRYPAHNQCFAVALSSEDGAATLYVPGSGDMGTLARVAHAQPFSCETARLFTLVERERLPRPNLIKIDVEGAELMVLDGAEPLLDCEEAPVVLFEYPLDTAPRFDYAANAVLQRLRSYRASRMEIFHFAEPRHLRPVTVPPVSRMNLVGIPARRLARFEDWIAI